MTEELTKLGAGEPGEPGEPGAPAVDDFYVRRINWLIETGRVDLIDEIADDCERRRAAHAPTGSGRAAARPPASQLASSHDSPATAATVPTPVVTGTRLAVDRLRRFASGSAWLR
jgi:hypothetical protein